MRFTAVLFVLVAVIALCYAAPCSRALENLQGDISAQGKQQYVLSMQRCKGNKQWTLHGFWPAAQNCGTDFSMDKIAPLIPQLEIDWPSCPEFGKSNKEFWEHEYTKHLTCHMKKTGMSQIEVFQFSLDLLEQYRGRCKDSMVGECRVGLDENLKPIN